MKTADQKLQHVKEAAGECYHVASEGRKVFEDTSGKFRIRYCIKCGESWDKCIDKNPSPDDLNELFRLAEKLFTKDEMFINSITFCPKFGTVSIMIQNPNWLSVDLVTFKEKTFLDTLFIATGGKDE